MPSSTLMLPRNQGLMRLWTTVPGEAWLMLWGFLVLTLGLGILTPFPTGFDELQHLSYLRAMQEAPSLMPAQGTTFNLDLATLQRWTAERNHLNHPPLYYLVLGAITPSNWGVLPLRALNTALVGAAAALTLVAGCRLLPGRRERILFALASLTFPKAMVIGGNINNDNLATLAGAMVFAGMAGLPGAAWWMGAALAIAGWTKLNALIALGAAAGLFLFWQEARNWRSWTIVAGGAMLGVIPSLLNLLTIGKLLWVDEQRYFTPPALRPDFDPLGYLLSFIDMFAAKWGAMEYAAPGWACVMLMLVPFGLALLGARQSPRSILPAYALALVITLALHVGFGWESYRSIGDLSIPQPRYYQVFWPGLSVGIALGLARLWQARRALGVVLMAALLWPTAIGGIVIAAF